MRPCGSAAYFVPQGNIVIERFSDGHQQEHSRQGKYLLNNIPLVVLVNGGSASASEIVAGAIQDAGTGKLLGTQTYGKGSVQLPNQMSDGSQLRVTIARWFTPKDRGIDGTGLAPDIQVPDPTADQIKAKQDPQLDRAVQYLLDRQIDDYVIESTLIGGLAIEQVCRRRSQAGCQQPQGAVRILHRRSLRGGHRADRALRSSRCARGG